MEARLCRTNREFAEQYLDLLNRYPEKTQLLTINCQDRQDESLPKNAFRGGVYQDGILQLVFLNALPYNLQLYSETMNKEAVNYLAKAVIDEQIEIHGVQGNIDHTSTFIEAYALVSNQTFDLHLQMDIMRVDQLIQPPLKGLFMVVGSSDIETILQMQVEFYKEALHEDVTVDKLRENTEKQIERGSIHAIYNEFNQILSMAMSSRKLHSGVAITMVYTPVKYRNQGYSSSCVYELCRKLMNEGNQFITLFVDKTNPVSNRVYLKVGFRVVENSYDWILSFEKAK